MRFSNMPVKAALIAVAIGLFFVSHAETWTFAATSDFVHGDWTYPHKYPEREEPFTYFFSLVKEAKSEMLWLSGDYVMGHWGSDPAIIREKCEKYYTAFRNRIAANGIETFYAAIGDHEVGDWPNSKGSWQINQRPYHDGYRDFMKMPQNGPAHLKGTAFYVKYKNILAIAMDPFDSSAATGLWGYNEIYEAQQKWLEETIKQNRDGVDFILVFCHNPILQPQASCRTSGVKMAGRAESVFWKSMVELGVSAYFAGEVHAYSHEVRDGIHHIIHGGYGSCPLSYAILEVDGDKGEIRVNMRQIFTNAPNPDGPTDLDSFVIQSRVNPVRTKSAELKKQSSFRIFQKSSATINVSMPHESGEARLILSTLSGQQVLSKTFHAKAGTQDIAVSKGALPSGMYICLIKAPGISISSPVMISTD